MKFLPMHELLQPAWKQQYAIPAFCAWNGEVMETILQVATDLKAPVILMNGPGEFPLNPPDTMGRIARAVAQKYNVPAALHLDHGDSPGTVQACLDAGYTSVMLDYSTRPFAENVAGLQAVVGKARPRGITVEGEIGSVGKVDDSTVEGGKVSTLTDPAEAARYAELTGVDALAVSIGNAHGIYTRLPVFDFERLEKIRKAVGVPLVLHGGSGTQPEYIKRAVSLGMAKINVASELCKAFRDVYAEEHAQGKTGWLPTILGATKARMAEVMARWFTLSGAAGKA
ncbi:MAG TPA: class II fructose-bisphosphate aldolase [Candidatus Limnocylindrales bacterium]|nr:class II fructose-bisphosphate aldolase [Candidatus Limnocylindrales bacterium]